MDEKKKIVECYAEMWARTFDFGGLTKKRDYWLAVLIHVVISLAIVSVLLLVLSAHSDWLCLIMSIICGLYFLASFIPFTSLTVRRLHDAGLSGWYYIFIYLFGIGFIFCTVTVAQTVYVSSMPCVYGPPPEDYYQTEFDPEENTTVGVYGSPDFYADETSEETNVPTEETEFNPEDNTAVCVYGPPEAFE